MNVLNALAAGEHREITIEVAKGAEVRFRIRKLTSEMLARHGAAVLFTDLPADLDTLLQGGDDLTAVQAAGERGQVLAQQIQQLRKLGPGFFAKQAKQGDATVCAGVAAVWQEDDGETARLPGAEDAEGGGYWQPVEFTQGTPEPARGRLPLGCLGKSTRDKLAQAITTFSNDDGEVADRLRTFRRDDP